MPKKTLHTFRIQHLAILDDQGVADPKLEPKLSPAQLKKMFEKMLLVREFDHRAIRLQRQGRIGPYAAAWGQEAIHIGTAAALEKEDWVVPSFREQGVYLFREIRPATLFLFFMGSEEGNRLARRLHTLPYSVPCASQILHAVGLAMAAKIKKDPVAVITYFGDGATSEGDFHEGLNFSGVYQTPNLFICQNNQWAISTPLEKQTHSATLAQKAIAYEIEGLQVDGNDVLAIYQATEKALNRARSGKGPSFLECLTYRVGAHTTSDDPSRYRDEAMVELWLKKDPLDRFEKYLLKKGVLQEGEREGIQETLAEKLKAEAIVAEEICRRLTPDQMFSYLFENMPEILRPQLENALQHYSAFHTEGVVHG